MQQCKKMVSALNISLTKKCSNELKILEIAGDTVSKNRFNLLLINNNSNNNKSIGIFDSVTELHNHLFTHFKNNN